MRPLPELAESLLSLVLDGDTPLEIECWAPGDGIPFGTSLADTDILIASGRASVGGRSIDVVSHGSGASPLQRSVSAILETAEVIAFHEAGADVRGSVDVMKEATGELVDPRACVLPAREAIEHLPFDETTDVDWARATTLDGRARWIHRPVSFGSRGFYGGTSNGVSAGQSITDALFRATLEIVERDAFFVHWFGRFGAAAATVEDVHAPVLGFLRSKGFDADVYDLTTDLGVAVAGVVLTHDTGPLDLPAGATITGAGAALDPTTAVTKALHECVQTVEKLTLHQAHDVALDEATGPHLRHYLEADRTHVFDFLARGPRIPCTPSTRARSLDDIVAALARQGRELLYRVITPSWLSQTMIEIVEAWIPGLHPLDLAIPARRVVSRRLTAFAERLGMSAADVARRALACPIHPLG